MAYNVIPRSTISEAAFQSLLNNGNARMVQRSISYVLDELYLVAQEYRQVAPNFEAAVKRILRECIHLGEEYGGQRARFMIFERFATVVIRYLVSQATIWADPWPDHQGILQIERDIMIRWRNWFFGIGVHLEVRVLGFRREARRHYRTLKNLVSDETTLV